MKALQRLGLGVLSCAAWTSPAVAQQTVVAINETYEGVFGPKKAAQAPIADTLRVVAYVMTLVHHEGAVRQECRADFSDFQVETGLEPGMVEWQCSPGAARARTFAEFDYHGDAWLLRFSESDGPSVRFARIGKKVWAEDLKPRAVQPDSAYAARVVADVRALYQRVDSFPCAAHDAGFTSARSFSVCAKGPWIGRVVLVGWFEATRIREEFTYDSTGVLRFHFETQSTNGDVENIRLYFADNRLVRMLTSEGNGTPKKANPSAENWAFRDSSSRSLAAACMELARQPATEDEEVSLFCNKDP